MQNENAKNGTHVGLKEHSIVKETDRVCAECPVGKNSSECMRILRGLSDKECLLQKAAGLKYAARFNEANQV